MADIAPSAFGAWLRRQRKLAGLTQEELANRARLSARGIAAIERGRRRQPQAHTVRSLASALGVPESEQAAALALLVADEPNAPEAEAQPILLPFPPLVPLVGRDAVLESVLDLIDDQRERLVTLTGPGGVGKTTLSLAIAHRAETFMPDGVIFVPLDALTDATALPAWIASRLGLTVLVRGSEWDTLTGFFVGRRTLLVLDNFEHVLGAAPDVARLLAASPGLQVLVTSRAPLRLRHEREVPVDPLPVPDLSHIPTPDEIASSEAVQLFVERARGSNPSFAVTQANATAIAAICRRLDGLPLALELAAARLRILSPTELLARLDQVLPVLVGGARDLPERQRTIRQAIDWSYRLLAPGEQALFRRLATFTGGWDLEAAEVIGAGLDLDGVAPLDVLTGLVEHSLVVVDAVDTSHRYRMLETIRAFGREELAARGELAGATHAHAMVCLTLAERAAAHHYGPEEADWLDRLEHDHPNLRAAVTHAVETVDEDLLLRLVASLGRLWLRREYIGDSAAWREMALGSLRKRPPTPLSATVLFHIGRLTWERGDRESGVALLRESLAHWSGAGDVRGASGAMVILANMLRLSGQPREADQLLEEARSRLAELGDAPFWHSLALRLLGIRAIEREDFPAAEGLLRDALATARKGGDPWSVGSALHNLADVMHRRGDHEHALELFVESLGISLHERDRWSVAVTLPPLANVVAALGEAEAAARVLGAAQRLAEVMAVRLVVTIPVDERQERTVAHLRRVLGEVAFEEAWREGRSFTAAEAIAHARAAVAERRRSASMAPAVPGSALPAGLTQREVEVIRLVVSGSSNAEAAEALFLSRRTVDAHLRRIYDKLDLGSRVELARFAQQHALLGEQSPVGTATMAHVRG